MTNNEAQQHIAVYTTAYQDVFKDEYTAFLNMAKVKVKVTTNDNKHAQWKNTVGEWRQWGEIPATLFNLLKSRLTDTEWQWFQSTEGQRWFFTKHPQYKVAGGKL